MPRISVVFYQEDAQTVPMLDWLDRLPAKAQDKCRVRIERLRDLGHELRRPETDYLRDGNYELRGGLQRAVEKDRSASLRSTDFASPYRKSTPPLIDLRAPRIWDLFEQPAISSDGSTLVKEREVPPREVEEAIQRKRKFELNPERHTYREG